MSENDKKVDVSMLTGAKDLERSLAKEEAERVLDVVPDGHILKDELEKHKELLGDLADLPPGHPLVQALVDAKARYETQDQREDEQSKTAEVRKAKKIDKDKAQREREARRLEAEEVRKQAANGINKGIDILIEGVRALYGSLEEVEGVLNEEPVCKSKVLKLKRLMFAMERGVSECRIKRV